MQLIDELTARRDDHAAWRRDIHAHPELAYQEHRTADFVAARLAEFGIPTVRGLGGTGLVGTLKCGGSDRAIGLRADMDALPLQELNRFDHASRHAGVMHACGHDGHTAMLLAAAEHLARTRDFDGIVHFIFQPAEEGEAGAKAMMDDGLFRDFPMESVYALHNWPGLPVGRMAMRKGAAMAAMDIFEVHVEGVGGHAALPHLARDPILAASELVQAWQSIVSRSVKAIEPAVLTVTQFHAGDAYNVIPAEVVLRGTVRCFAQEVRQQIEARMQEIAEGVCRTHGCSFRWRYEHRFPPTVNSAQETDFAAAAAIAVCGAEHVDTDVEPVTGSEDFGYMLEEKPGCYAFIGNGSSEGGCMLHSPHFDFNDDIIPIGASYWVRLVHDLLAPEA
ncbi:MAG: amidohydrolase [Gammaproteobacteria bacterium]|nr:amidohydrolase [Gammaproteobacteria bacterium]MCP5200781.1 amidohydrolase [Gammaproteobacteria bacterium]